MSTRIPRPRRHAVAVLVSLVAVAGVAFAAATASGAPTVSPLPLSDALIGPPPISSSLYADVADKYGFFKKVGLDMSFKYYGHGTDVSKSVLGGDQEVGTTATTAVIPLIAHGAPLKLLFGMDNVDWVVASSASGVTTCASLKGQSVGTDGSNNARQLFLAALLQTCGLSMSDVKQVSIGAVPADISKAAIEGQVKTDVLHISELAQIEELSGNTKWTVIPAPKTLPKQFHYLVGFTTASELQSHREAVVRFVAAYILARNWIMTKANQGKFAALAATAQGTSLGVAASGLKLMAAIPYWAPGMGLSKVNLGNTVKTLVAIGTIPANTAPGYDTMVDTTVYRDALKLANKVMAHK